MDIAREEECTVDWFIFEDLQQTFVLRWVAGLASVRISLEA